MMEVHMTHELLHALPRPTSTILLPPSLIVPFHPFTHTVRWSEHREQFVRPVELGILHPHPYTERVQKAALTYGRFAFQLGMHESVDIAPPLTSSVGNRGVKGALRLSVMMLVSLKIAQGHTFHLVVRAPVPKAVQRIIQERFQLYQTGNQLGMPGACSIGPHHPKEDTVDPRESLADDVYEVREGTVSACCDDVVYVRLDTDLQERADTGQYFVKVVLAGELVIDLLLM